MKVLVLLFFILSVLAQEQENDTNRMTKTLTGGIIEITKRPEYKGYPYARAVHPVIGFDNGNGKSGKDEIFNFCGHPDGFHVDDFGEDCFLLPWAISIIIPPLIFTILVLFFCYSGCIYSCCRMCLGQCCFATEGCCYALKPKQYNKKDWLGFMITTIVLVVVLQLPFFITGIVGNSSMTSALSGMSSETMDIYPGVKDVTEGLFKTLESLSLEPVERMITAFQNMISNMGNTTKQQVNMFTPEQEKFEKKKEAVSKIGKAIKEISINSNKNMTKQQLKTVDKYPLKETVDGVRETLKGITKIMDPVMDTVEMILDILIIFREIIFDLVLILPMIGGILMIIGAILRIHQLAVSFFPCAFFFSYFAISFVASEFPVTTVVADGCVMLYNVLEGVKQSDPPEIKSIDGLMDLFGNSTETLLSQFLKIFVDCETSIIGNIQQTFNNIVDDIISTSLGLVNFTFFDNILTVCDDSGGIFYNDGSYTCGNTKCVYDKLQYSLDNNKKPDNLINCNGVDRSTDINKLNFLEKLAKFSGDLKKMYFVNQYVYWVDQKDFAAYGVEKEGKDDIDLNDIMSDLSTLDGLIDPEALSKMFGGGNTKKQIKETNEMSKLKGAGNLPVYCADLDGKIIKGDKYGSYVNKTANYTYTPIACNPSELISLKECPQKCPSIVGQIVNMIQPLMTLETDLNAVLKSINDVKTSIKNISDFLGCGTIGQIIEDLPPTFCETYLRSETTMVFGLIAYGTVLWIIYIFGLVAIKRFNYANYLPIEKDDKRYYNQGEIELE